MQYIEKRGPLFASVILFFLFFCITQIINFSKPEQYKEILASIITLGSISVGFSAAILTILVTISTTTIAALRNKGYLRFLVSYMMEAIYSSIGLVILGLLGLFIMNISPIYIFEFKLSFNQILICTIASFSVHNLLCFVRNIKIIKLIIMLPPESL